MKTMEVNFSKTFKTCFCLVDSFHIDHRKKWTINEPHNNDEMVNEKEIMGRSITKMKTIDVFERNLVFHNPNIRNTST